jgi:hypothetical protein
VWKREERGDSGSPHFFLVKKYVITHKPKTKLNSDCTVKFVSINPSKQDYMDIFR